MKLKLQRGSFWFDLIWFLLKWIFETEIAHVKKIGHKCFAGKKVDCVYQIQVHGRLYGRNDPAKEI
jgi:hypothetical protein